MNFESLVNQVVPDRNLRGDIELREQFLLPLWTKQFGADNENFGKTRAGNQLTDDQPGADCFAETDVVREQGDRQTATEGNEIGNLVVVGFYSVTPSRLRL